MLIEDEKYDVGNGEVIFILFYLILFFKGEFFEFLWVEGILFFYLYEWDWYFFGFVLICCDGYVVCILVFCIIISVVISGEIFLVIDYVG